MCRRGTGACCCHNYSYNCSICLTFKVTLIHLLKTKNKHTNKNVVLLTTTDPCFVINNWKNWTLYFCVFCQKQLIKIYQHNHPNHNFPLESNSTTFYFGLETWQRNRCTYCFLVTLVMYYRQVNVLCWVLILKLCVSITTRQHWYTLMWCTILKGGALHI